MNAEPNQEEASRAYYDEFAQTYESRRGGSVPHGYHELLDELESGYVEKFGRDQDVLEVGCGTGLVLHRIAGFARSAEGIDLSEGMLALARKRGLSVQQGSATELPYPDERFDVTCSFKVLAHVPDIERALAEMARVTRKGGTVLAEFYNPNSFRGLARRLGPARKIGQSRDEADVYTRFDSPRRARQLTPPGCRFIEARGIRIVSPVASLVEAPLLGKLVYRAEVGLADTPLRNLAGFYVAAYRKES